MDNEVEWYFIKDSEEYLELRNRLRAFDTSEPKKYPVIAIPTVVYRWGDAYSEFEYIYSSSLKEMFKCVLEYEINKGAWE